MTFTALTEAQRNAIQSTQNWPDHTDWLSEIEQVGRHFSEARAEREAWLKSLREPPAEERAKVEGLLRLTRELRRAWADSSLDETDLPDLGLKLRQQRAEAWLHYYDIWVTPFAGKSDPMQKQLEWELMSIWVEAGGRLDYSRKQEKKPSSETRGYRRAGRHAPTEDRVADNPSADRPGTPYGQLINFLTIALEAILGKKYQPSGIAKMIDAHRPEIANARGMTRRRRGGRFA
ncbi:hypothetical protein ACWAT4_16275 [Bradyrhizobium manausense]